MTLQVGDLIPIGGSGNVKKSEVLAGKTYSSDEGVDMVGTMPNHGSLSKTITTQNGKQIITPGYYEGGEVKAQFNNLVSENIKDGINIGGVVGELPALYYNKPAERSSWSEKERVVNFKDLNLIVNKKDSTSIVKNNNVVFEAPSYYFSGVFPREVISLPKGASFSIYRLRFEFGGHAGYVSGQVRIMGPNVDTGWLYYSPSDTRPYLDKEFLKEPLNFIVGETYKIQIKNAIQDTSSALYLSLNNIITWAPVMTTNASIIKRE